MKTNDNDILGGGDRLLERVRQEAPTAERMRFALGYLFLSGLAPVWDALQDSGSEVHLLIGNMAGQPTDEQRVAALEGQMPLDTDMDVAAGARAERDRVVSEMAAAIRANLAKVPRSGANARLLTELAQSIISNRVRVRIYPHGRLHAKAYLFERPSNSTAMVGSSNVTLPSPGNPTELNVVVREADRVGYIARWFDELWQESQDFSRDLISELTASWPMAPDTAER